jgi:hypothetical protein
MESDIYSSSETSGTMPYGGPGTMSDERRTTDYVSNIEDTVSSGAGQLFGFISERPLLVGSVFVGAIGAFVGSRLGQMVAMRRRKTTYDRAMESLGVFRDGFGGMVSNATTSKTMNRLAHTGRNIAGSTEGMRESMVEGLPVVGRTRVEQPSVIRQIGYGLSLIPIAMALIRNPLIRDIGFRFLARRVRRK